MTELKMEEQVPYSTMVLKNVALTEQEEKADMATSSGEKSAEPASTEPKGKDDPEAKPETKTEEPVTVAPKGRSALESGVILSLVCLGILFLVLVVVVAVLLVQLNMVMRNQEATLTDLEAKNKYLILENGNLTNQTRELLETNGLLENEREELLVEKTNLTKQTQELREKNGLLENQTEQLLVEKRNLTNQVKELREKNGLLENQTKQLLVENRNLTNQTNQLLEEKSVLQNLTKQLMEKTKILENQTAQLTKEKDDLNWTLEVILTFDNFPVTQFCPQKKCQPCLDGWIMSSESCYLFYPESELWKSWNESRQFCQNQSADLVVIDSLEEQTFVTNHSSFYFDEYHGFWLGLQNISSAWTWVDGHIDTLQYWISGTSGASGRFALLVPNRALTGNWNAADNGFKNRFICEGQALIRAN